MSVKTSNFEVKCSYSDMKDEDINRIKAILTHYNPRTRLVK